MKPVLTYVIEVLICSGIFMCLYQLLASRTSFKACRKYLIYTAFLSMLIPALRVPIYPAETKDITYSWQTGESPTGAQAVIADIGIYGSKTETGKTGNAESATTHTLPSRTIAIAIYMTGVIVSLAILIFQTFRIIRLKRRATLTFMKGCAIAESEHVSTPFSFWNTVYMGKGYDRSEKEQILCHEVSHIRHGHTTERIVMSVLKSLFWFNPFFHVTARKLEEVQEWEADRDVLMTGFDVTEYRKTIFKQLFGYYPDISCGLNNSLTKRRFIMMTRNNRGRISRLMLILALPLSAGMLLTFGATAKTPAEGNNLSGIQTEAREQKDSSEIIAQYRVSGSFRLDIRDGKIYCGNTLLSTEDNSIPQLVDSLVKTKKVTIAQICAEDDTPVGIITDIKTILGKTEVRRFEYISEENNTGIITGKEGCHAPEAIYTPDRNGVKTLEVRDEGMSISWKNIFMVCINPKGKLLIIQNNDGRMTDENRLAKELTDFIAGPSSTAEKIGTDFRLPDGKTWNYPVSKAVICIRASRSTQNKAYMQLQQTVYKAYESIRNDAAKQAFGKTLDQLSDAEKAVIHKAVPMNITEAEPKSI